MKNAVVADAGSFAARFGFKGEDVPCGWFPASVGVIESSSSSSSSSNKGSVYHFDINNFREDMNICNPTESNGKTVDWDLLEGIYMHAYEKYLKVGLDEQPLYVTEKACDLAGEQQALNHRKKMAELMYESHNVPSMYFGKDAAQACYAGGHITGVVADIAYHRTTVSPVVDGYVESASVFSNRVAGKYLDCYMDSLLREQNFDVSAPFRVSPEVKQNKIIYKQLELANVHPNYDKFMKGEVTRGLKEGVCIMSQTPAISDSNMISLPAVPYELPDGHLVNIGNNRYMVSELVCYPKMYSKSGKRSAQEDAATARDEYEDIDIDSEEGCPRMVTRSVMSCAFDVRPALLKGLVITGGTSAILGMPERIQREVTDIIQPAAPHWGVSATYLEISRRGTMNWIGGSVLACLSSFDEHWVTKASYEEEGIHRIYECP